MRAYPIWRGRWFGRGLYCRLCKGVGTYYGSFAHSLAYGSDAT